MDVGLGMHVYTSDNRDLGTVDRLILDPERGSVKAAVVRKGALLHRDVEVPIETMSASPSGDARIGYTLAEADQLPRFEEASYTMPPTDYVPPMGFPSTAVYWPIGYGTGVAPPPVIQLPEVMAAPAWTGDSAVDRKIDAALRREDLENAVIGEGSDVLGRDGEKVGTVRELAFDPANSKLTGLVVHKGLLLGKDTELPVSLIDSIDDGVVYLKVDAREAER
jgi:sporulation protein YlmC with PRC-barrel domain